MVSEMLKNLRLSSSGRKLLTSQQKAYLVEEWESSGFSCPEFCRQYGLIASQLYKWRKDAKSGAVMSINDELKKALGEATLDIKVLKKKLEMDQQRNRQLNRYPGNSD